MVTEQCKHTVSCGTMMVCDWCCKVVKYNPETKDYTVVEEDDNNNG